MNPIGRHFILELYDCDRAVLNDPEDIEQIMNDAAVAGGATIVSSHTNRFNPYGISAVVIIAESHLTIHTWPEHGYAAVDVFTCSPDIDAQKMLSVMETRLRAKSHAVQELTRGMEVGKQLPNTMKNSDS